MSIKHLALLVIFRQTLFQIPNKTSRENVIAKWLTRTIKLYFRQQNSRSLNYYFKFGGDNLETKIIQQRIDPTKRIDLTADKCSTDIFIKTRKYEITKNKFILADLCVDLRVDVV